MTRIRRFSSLATSTAILLLVGAGVASSQSRFRLGVSAGAAIPVGSFDDRNDPGLSVGAHVLYTSPFFPQNFKLEVQHNRLAEAAGDARAMITSGTFNLEWTPTAARARVAPYVSAGLGAYYMKMGLRGTTAGATRYDDVTKFGTNAGGGIRLAPPGVNLFIDARYHWVRSHGQSFPAKVRYIPIVIGVTL